MGGNCSDPKNQGPDLLSSLVNAASRNTYGECRVLVTVTTAFIIASLEPKTGLTVEAEAYLCIRSSSTEYPHPIFKAISVYKMKFLATAVILCLAVLYTQALPAEMPSSPLLLSRVARSPQFPPRDCVPCNCKTKITHITIIEHEVRPAATRFGGSPPCCPCPPPPF
ncbi:uncharacterized protein LOC125036978 [Penaeus chinensis]|uniref:uncharacterized protein LOC125036978 n=1 Tax=Penaeus chinensis TaxID=139456 RepID=UPI001FB7DCD3|nr:uncharacterized protein LOC125036978 [Penaeus chinensis]